MGTTRFIKSFPDNKIIRLPGSALTYPRIINGLAGSQYPSAPARVEDPAFPMENMLHPSRYLPWCTPLGTSSSAKIHIDLGSNQNVRAVGVHGHRLMGAGLFPTSCVIGYRVGTGTAPAFGYTATGFTSIVSLQLGRRDSVFVMPAAVSMRYIEIDASLVSSDGWAMSNPLVAVTVNDLGFLYADGAADTLVHTRARSRAAGGHLTVMKIGDPRRLVSMPLLGVDDSTKTLVDSVFGEATAAYPVTWIDTADRGVQVMLAQDELTWTHRWAAPNVWDCNLELEVLG